MERRVYIYIVRLSDNSSNVSLTAPAMTVRPMELPKSNKILSVNRPFKTNVYSPLRFTATIAIIRLPVIISGPISADDDFNDSDQRVGMIVATAVAATNGVWSIVVLILHHRVLVKVLPQHLLRCSQFCSSAWVSANSMLYAAALATATDSVKTVYVPHCPAKATFTVEFKALLPLNKVDIYGFFFT